MHWKRTGLLRAAVLAAAFVASRDAAAADPAADEVKDEATTSVGAPLDRRIPELHVNANAFADVIDFAQDVTGVDLFVSWRNRDTVGIKHDSAVTYSGNRAKLSEALTGILDAAGHKGPAACGVVGHVVVLSTPADLRLMQDALAKHIASHEPAALARPLPEAHFNANALSDVIDFPGDVSHVKFRPDWPALRAAGVEHDAPVTSRLHRVPTGETLLLVLDSISTAAALAAGPTTQP